MAFTCLGETSPKLREWIVRELWVPKYLLWPSCPVLLLFFLCLSPQELMGLCGRDLGLREGWDLWGGGLRFECGLGGEPWCKCRLGTWSWTAGEARSKGGSGLSLGKELGPECVFGRRLGLVIIKLRGKVGPEYRSRLRVRELRAKPRAKRWPTSRLVVWHLFREFFILMRGLRMRVKVWGKAVVGMGTDMGLGVSMRLGVRRRLATMVDVRQWLEI